MSFWGLAGRLNWYLDKDILGNVDDLDMRKYQLQF